MKIVIHTYLGSLSAEPCSKRSDVPACTLSLRGFTDIAIILRYAPSLSMKTRLERIMNDP